ncbi:MAG: XdhC family protein [Nevskiales bacterium]|nr:XdhC family protein [Nevskiales bacterium]
MNTPQEFGVLIDGFRRLESTGFAGGAALVTLTRTHGPTYRRPGARMLVFGDGTVIRGLAGGCPEADIVTRARAVIAAGRAELVRYDREHGLDALLELGCGGELEVLIEPLSRASDLQFVTAAERCLRTRTPGFLATAFTREGACLCPRPQRLVWSEQVLCDELEDPAFTSAVVSHAAGLQDKKRPQVARFETARGSVDVLVESLLPPPAAVLIGVNAGSLALARIAGTLGWTVTLVDHRTDHNRPEGIPAGTGIVTAGPEELTQRIFFDRRTFAVVMTHNVERDIAYLNALRALSLGYLGAIGSRQRVHKVLEACGAMVTPLHAPAGLDLGSETPEEIALAIAAEMLAVTSGHSGAPLYTVTGPLH